MVFLEVLNLGERILLSSESKCNKNYRMGIGSRLKAERIRLGLNQREMAAHGGIAPSAYHNYENDTRAPSSDVLLGLASGGVDIWFVLFGSPSPDALTPDEALILMDYRALSEQEKFKASVAIRQLGLSSNNPLPAVHDAPASSSGEAAKSALEQAGVKIKGDAGNINTGPVDQSNMTMIVGRRAKVIKRDEKK